MWSTESGWDSDDYGVAENLTGSMKMKNVFQDKMDEDSNYLQKPKNEDQKIITRSQLSGIGRQMDQKYKMYQEEKFLFCSEGHIMDKIQAKTNGLTCKKKITSSCRYESGQIFIDQWFYQCQECKEDNERIVEEQLKCPNIGHDYCKECSLKINEEFSKPHNVSIHKLWKPLILLLVDMLLFFILSIQYLYFYWWSS